MTFMTEALSRAVATPGFEEEGEGSLGSFSSGSGSGDEWRTTSGKTVVGEYCALILLPSSEVGSTRSGWGASMGDEGPMYSSSVACRGSHG